jgi:hypothetical protein
MFEMIQATQKPESPIRGGDLTAPMNSLLHSKPDSAPWNLIQLTGAGFGHAVSKILDRPELCDELCANAIPWLVVVQAMMAAYFADEPQEDFDGKGSAQ